MIEILPAVVPYEFWTFDILAAAPLAAERAAVSLLQNLTRRKLALLLSTSACVPTIELKQICSSIIIFNPDDLSVLKKLEIQNENLCESSVVIIMWLSV